jgi:hypothetical protein
LVVAFWLEGLDGFFCCFWGYGFVRTLLYIVYVRMGALRFSNKLQPYLSKKKKKGSTPSSTTNPPTSNSNSTLLFPNIIIIVFFNLFVSKKKKVL